MMNKTAFTISLLSCLAGPSLVNADTQCRNASLDPARESALLRPTTLDECNSVWDSLESSRKFPHIFAQNQTHLYPGLCYVSMDNGIAAKLGNQPVTISSASAWTTEFFPILIGGPDTMATVITQWKVTNDRGRLLGKVYTADAVDINASSEYNVVVGGSHRFSGAKGAIRIDSEPVPNPYGANLPPLIKITNISGTLCVDD